MRKLAFLLLLLMLPAPAVAQGTAAFAVVQAGDASEQRTLVHLHATLAFVDADSDGRVDAADPAEPVLLDLDNSRTVSYGDLRLTPHGPYAAGTWIDIANLDEGRALSTPPGWFARTGQGAWLLDLDGSRTVSVADVRLSTGFGTRIAAGDTEAGQTLEVAQQQLAASLRVGYVDLDADNARDASEPLYLDLDPNGSPAQGRITAGDLRLTPLGASRDDAPTRAEFDAALSQVGVQRGDDGYVGTASSAWTGPVVLAVVLGVLNLLGLAFVAARLRGRAPRPPGDPFQ